MGVVDLGSGVGFRPKRAISPLSLILSLGCRLRRGGSASGVEKRALDVDIRMMIS